MSVTTALFVVFAIWIATGLLTGVAMGRRRRSWFGWTVIGCVLGPLVIPVAVNAHLAKELAHQLVGPSAILQLHFHKEEDVLLPVLDTSLSADEAAALFARMGNVAHT